MNGLIKGWARWVVRGRWAVLALVAAAIGASFLPMSNLYYDNSNERFFLEGDPNLATFNDLLYRFGDVEYLSVGVDAPMGDVDLFTPETLGVISELTRFLEDQPEVTQVRSLSKYQYTHSGGGMLSTDTVFEEIDNSAALAEGRDIMVNEEMALGSLLTEDLRHTRIAARVQYESGSSELKMSLMASVREFIETQDYEARGYPLRLSGQPVFTEQFEVLSKNDQAWINPAMALVMIIILAFSFRSVTGTLVPWVLIGTAITLVTGIQGLMRWPHSVVESALVPALIIIGVGVSVHVLVEFYRFRAEGQTPKAAAQSTIEHLWVPAFFTAFTTAAGFMALSVTQLLPVQQFAWLGAIGAMTLFLLAMTLLPAVLSFIPWFSDRTRHSVDTGLVARITTAVPGFTYRNRRLLTLLGATLLAISLALIPRIEVDSNFITYFKKSNPTRADLNYFDDKYNGIQNVDLMIDSGEVRGIHDPAFLSEVDSLQQWLETQPETGEINSLIDFHKRINQSLNFDDPAYARLPDSREMAAQFLLLYDNSGSDEDLTDAKDFDERWLRMSVPVRNMAATETTAFLDRMKQYMQDNHPTLTTEISGSMVMYNAQDQYINKGMFQSFLVALVIMAASFMVLFRSLKYGLIALVPSIVPILMTGALLVILGIPLNLGTMVVGAMTMGIAVDDAIHMMNRYLRARGRGMNAAQAIESASNQAGRAVIFTSIVLVLGFSMMLFGSFIPYIYTGLFAASIMALALLGDLIFLPALLHLIDGRKAVEADHTPTLTPSSTGGAL
ncbi:efflux RND transporter permease subunit [Saccharospirillum impatiens]|uniref:efflux RND transporter permease subunit n=1 Tax=Saccharospirillum impatiens TaxID=169438 RepID=UPI0003FC2D7B|nr:efflux RND transporter permease subunit [Saccharospirillum impatiens]